MQHGRKKKNMAKEITGFLILEKTNPESFIPTNDVQFILGLNEGHDRPLWEWMLNGAKGDATKVSSIVPEKPETILLDGLLLLIADGLKDPSLLAMIDQYRSGSSALIDLNLFEVTDELRSGLASALEGYLVNIVILPGSHLKNNVSDFSKLGIEHRVLS